MSARVLGWTIVFFLATAAFVWYAALREDRRGLLELHVLSSGSSVIETPSGRWVLIDGGPDGSVVRELGALLPFYERSLAMIVSTTQSPERAAGLADVLDRYVVGSIVRTAAVSSAPQMQAVLSAVSRAQTAGTRLRVAKRGEVYDLGAGTYLEVLFPDRDASNMPPHDGCLVFRLSFGATSFLFSCGSSALPEYLAVLDGGRLRSDVLFVSGAQNAAFVGFVSPQFMVTCGARATSSFAAHTMEVSDCSQRPTFVSDGKTIVRK